VIPQFYRSCQSKEGNNILDITKSKTGPVDYTVFESFHNPHVNKTL